MQSRQQNIPVCRRVPVPDCSKHSERMSEDDFVSPKRRVSTGIPLRIWPQQYAYEPEYRAVPIAIAGCTRQPDFWNPFRPNSRHNSNFHLETALLYDHNLTGTLPIWTARPRSRRETRDAIITLLSATAAIDSEGWSPLVWALLRDLGRSPSLLTRTRAC